MDGLSGHVRLASREAAIARWNVTKERIRIPRVIPNDETWPPPGAVKPPPFDPSIAKDVSKEIAAGTYGVRKENQLIDDRVNKKFGTRYILRQKWPISEIRTHTE